MIRCANVGRYRARLMFSRSKAETWDPESDHTGRGLSDAARPTCVPRLGSLLNFAFSGTLSKRSGGRRWPESRDVEVQAGAHPTRYYLGRDRRDITVVHINDRPLEVLHHALPHWTEASGVVVTASSHGVLRYITLVCQITTHQHRSHRLLLLGHAMPCGRVWMETSLAHPTLLTSPLGISVTFLNPPDLPFHRLL